MFITQKGKEVRQFDDISWRGPGADGVRGQTGDKISGGGRNKRHLKNTFCSVLTGERPGLVQFDSLGLVSGHFSGRTGG